MYFSIAWTGNKYRGFYSIHSQEHLLAVTQQAGGKWKEIFINDKLTLEDFFSLVAKINEINQKKTANEALQNS